MDFFKNICLVLRKKKYGIFLIYCFSSSRVVFLQVSLAHLKITAFDGKLVSSDQAP